MNQDDGLVQCLAKIGQLQREAFDHVALKEVVSSAAAKEPRAMVKTTLDQLQLKPAKWLKSPDPAAVPALVHGPSGSWGVLRGLNAVGQWVLEWWDGATGNWSEEALGGLDGFHIARLSLARPFVTGNSPAYQMIRREILSNKKLLLEAVLGGVIINVVALGTSFYTLLVYDRVVPTGASQTLLVLTIGVMFAVLYEFFAKNVRARLYDRLIDNVDRRLAHTIYSRFLAIRLDQLPRSVGGMAGQIRGYETVRGFMTSVTTHLLVETVEGAETIKSGQGGWRMLSRWMSTADEARAYELDTRRISERSQFMIAAFQQGSYLTMIASGALMISRGDLTMGGLIACSILSGKILAPVAMVSNQLVQWAHTKAALNGLDMLWSLEDDHHGQEQPIVLDKVTGRYRFENVSVEYDGRCVLKVPNLVINPGEKVGILGPVGAGKTTLLRLLSGMYKPQSGRIFMDDVDLAHISKPVLADHMGWVQQEGRLFAGTLRDNLVLGLIDPGDDVLMETARRTGLLQAVLVHHPQGLQQPIYEGGTGLSGGQRQLVNLTRAFLRNPDIWLLDEPTASMDRNLEQQVLAALQQAMEPTHTLVLVTHKPELLNLVDRIIVVAKHEVVMDGPKAEVLQRLQAPPQQSGGSR